MKIVLFSLAFVLAYSVASAQFRKGTMLIGGGISGMYSEENAVTNASTSPFTLTLSSSVMPQAGYFLFDNFATGLGLDYQYSRMTERDSHLRSWSSTVSINPFVRYYYKSFFIQGMYYVGRGASRTINANIICNCDPSLVQPVEKTKTNGFNLGIGYAALINQYFAVEPLVGYSTTTFRNNASPNTKYPQPGFYIQVGFQVYLLRGHDEEKN